MEANGERTFISSNFVVGLKHFREVQTQERMTPWLKQANGEKNSKPKDRKADAQTMGVVTKSRSTMPQKNGCASTNSVTTSGGPFTEVGQLAGGEVDAFIAGIGSLNGRPVAVGCEDFTVRVALSVEQNLRNGIG